MAENKGSNITCTDKQMIGLANCDIDSNMMKNDKSSCYYVKSSIGHVKGGMLVDSGSPVSILSYKCYNRWLNKPKLEPVSVPLSTANGLRLEIKGKCMLTFEIEHIDFFI
jgi:hypothetical protein